MRRGFHTEFVATKKDVMKCYEAIQDISNNLPRVKPEQKSELRRAITYIHTRMDSIGEKLMDMKEDASSTLLHSVRGSIKSFGSVSRIHKIEGLEMELDTCKELYMKLIEKMEELGL